MKVDWFVPMVAQWSDRIQWTQSELERAAELLFEIGRANGGEALTDEDVPLEVVRDFALERAKNAIDRRVNGYARSLRDRSEIPRYSEVTESPQKLVVSFLKPHVWKPQIDINTANIEMLSSLPGIGRQIATRIVSARSQRGRFSTLEELDRIPGIGSGTLDAIRERVFFGNESHPAFMTEALSAFIEQPTFENYVELIAQTQGSFVFSRQLDSNPKLQILLELRQTLEDVEANPFESVQTLQLTRSSQIQIEQQRQERAALVSQRTVNSIRTGALLYDRDYLDFLRQLIPQARKSIHLVMFFLKYEEEKRYPTDALVKSLIEARGNGLDVKVILDTDAEGDVYRSRTINEPVYRQLQKYQVPVRYDLSDRLTHSKLLVVDGTHVVVGSHNWTAGSFYLYDDTSIYLESEELARHYEERFSTLWQE